MESPRSRGGSRAIHSPGEPQLARAIDRGDAPAIS